MHRRFRTYGTGSKALHVLVIVLQPLLVAQDTPVMDEMVKPAYFEALEYPLTARLAQTQGVVVVRVKLDSEGKVVSSAAISGAKSLIRECLSNSKKWLFRPNPDAAAVIVYQFKIEGLCSLPCRSQFTFFPPNLAIITMGRPVVDHAATP